MNSAGVPAAPRGEPQPWQNRAPSSGSVPHELQAATAVRIGRWRPDEAVYAFAVRATNGPMTSVVRLCRMAADIVPIRLGLTKGDLYTLWAPRWRDAGDEWEALLGKDDDLYGFESVADLAAFVRTNTDNDLTDHPAWEGLTEANAHRFDPPEERQYDLIGVQELLAEKPTEDSVATVHRALAIVSSIGSVCELSTVTKFFNGNPVLGSLGAGMDSFSGRSGRKRWSEIGAVIGRSWDNVVDAIDEVVTIPDVDGAASPSLSRPVGTPVGFCRRGKKSRPKSGRDPAEN